MCLYRIIQAWRTIVWNICLGAHNMYERKRLAAILIFTFCLITVLAIAFGSFLSRAKAKESYNTYYKYYTNIEIQPGDTLWNLADSYMENYESKTIYINEVNELNSLKDGKIVSGQSLIMPYYSTEYKL